MPNRDAKISLYVVNVDESCFFPVVFRPLHCSRHLNCNNNVITHCSIFKFCSGTSLICFPQCYKATAYFLSSTVCTRTSGLRAELVHGGILCMTLRTAKDAVACVSPWTTPEHTEVTGVRRKMECDTKETKTCSGRLTCTQLQWTTHTSCHLMERNRLSPVIAGLS